MRGFYTLILGLVIFHSVGAQSHLSIEKFRSPAYMRGASFSLLIKDLNSDSTVYSYDADRELIPASVMKIVTTATAIELLGDQYRYSTSLAYDGVITDSILLGNIYIIGSGDPSLGSSETGVSRDTFIQEWINAIRKAGIKAINGSVIADESIFDTEGVSMKWMREDMGSFYASGSYGINFNDNLYNLYLNTTKTNFNNRPEIVNTDPLMPSLIFRNQLFLSKSDKDSAYIIGYPFSDERYLYGSIPSNLSNYQLKGDIPDPPLFLAQYLTKKLIADTIAVSGKPDCYRLLSQQNNYKKPELKLLYTTYSPPLKELARICNFFSHNLYADAFLKTVGLKYKTEDNMQSFERGFMGTRQFWEEKGLTTSSLWMYDGSGLSLADKVTTSFICELLLYMYRQSPASKEFYDSLPRVGMEGTVSGFLNGSALQGKARLKSGSMSRVRSYAGYVSKDGKMYAVALIVNNFSCPQTLIRKDIEQLLLSLFEK